MLRIRSASKVLVVAVLVVALLLSDFLRPAPANADGLSTPAIIAIAFGAYMVAVLTVTTIIYWQREKKRQENRPDPAKTRDPYSFTSSQIATRLKRPPSDGDGLRFGASCAAHGPGTLFCW